MTEIIRWGILGTGNIAHQFARGLAVLPDAALVAVGSRAQETADAFAKEFGVPHSHATYETLAADPEVDAIYVSTPHPFHHENTLLCLNAGKHVLCEKPFAMNAAQAREMITTARSRSRFLMDAVWTRFLPAMVKVRELLSENAIGELRMLLADFGFRAQFNPEGRLFNPQLGGGALLDVGIYTVQLASMVMGGPPTEIAAKATLGETGVDEQSAMTFAYPGGQLAQLSCAIRTATNQMAWIYGTEGRMHLHSPWWRGTKVTVWQAGGPESGTLYDLPFEGNGYNYEAAEVMRCIREGRLESDVMPLDETLELMETLDAARAQWGLRYPVE
jgi:predicted dehydrogenase